MHFICTCSCLNQRQLKSGIGVSKLSVGIWLHFREVWKKGAIILQQEELYVFHYKVCVAIFCIFSVSIMTMRIIYCQVVLKLRDVV